MKRRKGYPHTSDIAEAIMDVLTNEVHLRPDQLYDKVKSKLEDKGFNTSYMTVKRVWRVYEEMVRKRRIYDVLGVIEYDVNDRYDELS
jgi:acyl carrier protein phosphodiesterase